MENVEDNSVKKEDKPGEMHELVFSPEKKALPAPFVLERYHRIPRFRSIRFNLWLTFVFMTIAMLAIMWLYELVFYSTLYVSFQENEMMESGNEFARGYVSYSIEDSDKLDGYIEDYATENGVNIVVFTLDDEGNSIVKYGATPNVGAVPGGLEGELLEYYLGKLSEPNESFVSNTTNIDSVTSEMVIYGFRTLIDREDIYLYMSTSLPSFGQARSTLVGQLAVITAVCLVISVFVAYMGSGFAARPMRELTVKVIGNSREGKREPLETNTPLAEINELSTAFNKAFDDVENNNRFRRDLLANVSHDMKTPLTMIRAYSEMIRDISGGNKEKATRHAQVIIDETNRLTSLINEVVELSKLESGVMNITPHEVDLSEKLNATVDKFRIMEETKGYTFESEIEDGLEVVADGDRIDRVVYNLIGNAMNYTGEDKTVRVRAYRKDQLARVEILDSGKGMTKEEMEAVWDKYYRLAQDKRRVVGSGLGLSIVKSILDLHQVNYGVASEKGNGSNFWFELPLL
ncbi:MAG: HAMP domain-containing histidine kinase [Clostridia bacterium]|nr:HAMP domain-containing histidine kinase [Clostridia bacterium]